MKKVLSVLFFFSIASCSSNLNLIENKNINYHLGNTSLLSLKKKSNLEAVEKFKKDVYNFGIKLTDEQLRTISTQINIKPSGRFASRPAHNLSAEENLDIHFKKHYKEFNNINSKEEYLKRAVEFLNNNSPTAKRYFDTQSFEKGYQSNVIKYDSKTFELSAMRSDGDVTTYYISKKLPANRFVEIPSGFVFN
jgi:hypothetical protein